MEYKQLFQRMNLDSDCRSLQPGEYRKLTNGITVPPASSSYENALRGVLHSLFGNAIVSYSLPSGTNQCIGYLEDRAGNRGFFFVYNSTAANKSIYQFKDGVITLVFRSALLDFLVTDFIDSDIVGDILFFTNARTDIYKLNITKAIAGGVYTPLLPEILLIKPLPALPVTWSLSYDNTISTNLLYGNYFQFFYRYIYEDFDYSVFSPCSKTTNSWSLPTGTAVKLVSGRGNITLSGLQVVDGVTTIANDRVLVISQTDPIENGIYLAKVGAWTRATDFPAGTTSDTTVYVTGGLIYYFSTVWRITSLNPGTIASYANLIQGPNKLTISRPVTPPATVIGIQYAVRINGTNEVVVYREEKVAAFSSSHSFYNNTFLFTVPDSESFVWNDSIPLSTESISYRNRRLFLFNNTEGYDHATTTSVTLSLSTISPPTTRVYNAAKAGARYNVGIVFKDFAGRHSGVRCDATITIPEYDYTNRYKISVNTSSAGTDIPSWATHFSIVSSKALNTFFLSQWTVDVYYFKVAADGSYTYSKSLTGFQADGTFIDISSLTKNNQGYTFSQGDRIKIKGAYYSTAGSKDIDLEITGQEGNFIKVRVLNELVLSTTINNNYIFEIYTPKVETAEPFYELGQTFAIGSFGGAFVLEGDIEIIRTPFYRDSTAYSNTNPFANIYEPSDVALVESEAMNAWGKNYTLWVTQSGRALVKGDSRELEKKTSIRFGQQFVLNSNFLGLNTFYALDEYALKVENGAGIILADGGNVLVALTATEAISIYIGEGFVSTTDSDQFLAKTESVIGDDRKLLGSHGTIHKGSVVSRDSRVYFLNARKGVIVRRSQDGLTVISDYGVRGLVSNLCTTHKALGANSRIIAGWDPQYDCYTISFIDITSTPTGITLYYHENSNSWVCQTDERPEFWGILEQQKIFFNAGALYLQSIEANYNNWGGVQYNRRLEFEISPMQSLVHLWDALEVDVASIYSTAGTNEDVVLLYHENGGILQTRINYLDFQLKERVYRSAFFRSLNDINFQNTTESKYKSPDQIRGQSAFMVITYNGTDKNVMKSITVFYTPSMNSNP